MSLLLAIGAHGLIPLLIPAAIVGIGAAIFGWNAPPHLLSEIGVRYLRAAQLFGSLLLAILGVMAAVLALTPHGIGFLGLAIPWMIAMPLLACWLFGLAWRLGYDTGLLLAHVHAARQRAQTRRPRR